MNARDVPCSPIFYAPWTRSCKNVNVLMGRRLREVEWLSSCWIGSAGVSGAPSTWSRGAGWSRLPVAACARVLVLVLVLGAQSQQHQNCCRGRRGKRGFPPKISVGRKYSTVTCDKPQRRGWCSEAEILSAAGGISNN